MQSAPPARHAKRSFADPDDPGVGAVPPDVSPERSQLKKRVKLAVPDVEAPHDSSPSSSSSASPPRSDSHGGDPDGRTALLNESAALLGDVLAADANGGPARDRRVHCSSPFAHESGVRQHAIAWSPTQPLVAVAGPSARVRAGLASSAYIELLALSSWMPNSEASCCSSAPPRKHARKATSKLAHQLFPPTLAPTSVLPVQQPPLGAPTYPHPLVPPIPVSDSTCSPPSLLSFSPDGRLLVAYFPPRTSAGPNNSTLGNFCIWAQSASRALNDWELLESVPVLEEGGERIAETICSFQGRPASKYLLGAVREVVWLERRRELVLKRRLPSDSANGGSVVAGKSEGASSEGGKSSNGCWTFHRCRPRGPGPDPRLLSSEVPSSVLDRRHCSFLLLGDTGVVTLFKARPNSKDGESVAGNLGGQNPERTLRPAASAFDLLRCTVHEPTFASLSHEQGGSAPLESPELRRRRIGAVAVGAARDDPVLLVAFQVERRRSLPPHSPRQSRDAASGPAEAASTGVDLAAAAPDSLLAQATHLAAQGANLSGATPLPTGTTPAAMSGFTPQQTGSMSQAITPAAGPAAAVSAAAAATMAGTTGASSNGATPIAVGPAGGSQATTQGLTPSPAHANPPTSGPTPQAASFSLPGSVPTPVGIAPTAGAGATPVSTGVLLQMATQSPSAAAAAAAASQMATGTMGGRGGGAPIAGSRQVLDPDHAALAGLGISTTTNLGLAGTAAAATVGNGAHLGGGAAEDTWRQIEEGARGAGEDEEREQDTTQATLQMCEVRLEFDAKQTALATRPLDPVALDAAAFGLPAHTESLLDLAFHPIESPDDDGASSSDPTGPTAQGNSPAASPPISQASLRLIAALQVCVSPESAGLQEGGDQAAPTRAPRDDVALLSWDVGATSRVGALSDAFARLECKRPGAALPAPTEEWHASPARGKLVGDAGCGASSSNSEGDASGGQVSEGRPADSADESSRLIGFIRGRSAVKPGLLYLRRLVYRPSLGRTGAGSEAGGTSQSELTPSRGAPSTTRLAVRTEALDVATLETVRRLPPVPLPITRALLGTGDVLCDARASVMSPSGALAMAVQDGRLELTNLVATSKASQGALENGSTSDDTHGTRRADEIAHMLALCVRRGSALCDVVKASLEGAKRDFVLDVLRRTNDALGLEKGGTRRFRASQILAQLRLQRSLLRRRDDVGGEGKGPLERRSEAKRERATSLLLLELGACLQALASEVMPKAQGASAAEAEVRFRPASVWRLLPHLAWLLTLLEDLARDALLFDASMSYPSPPSEADARAEAGALKPEPGQQGSPKGPDTVPPPQSSPPPQSWLLRVFAGEPFALEMLQACARGALAFEAWLSSTNRLEKDPEWLSRAIEDHILEQQWTDAMDHPPGTGTLTESLAMARLSLDDLLTQSGVDLEAACRTLLGFEAASRAPPTTEEKRQQTDDAWWARIDETGAVDTAAESVLRSATLELARTIVGPGLNLDSCDEAEQPSGPGADDGRRYIRDAVRLFVSSEHHLEEASILDQPPVGRVATPASARHVPRDVRTHALLEARPLPTRLAPIAPPADAGFAYALGGAAPATWMGLPVGGGGGGGGEGALAGFPAATTSARMATSRFASLPGSAAGTPATGVPPLALAPPLQPTLSSALLGAGVGVGTPGAFPLAAGGEATVASASTPSQLLQMLASQGVAPPSVGATPRSRIALPTTFAATPGGGGGGGGGGGAVPFSSATPSMVGGGLPMASLPVEPTSMSANPASLPARTFGVGGATALGTSTEAVGVAKRCTSCGAWANVERLAAGAGSRRWSSLDRRLQQQQRQQEQTCVCGGAWWLVALRRRGVESDGPVRRTGAEEDEVDETWAGAAW